MPLAPRWRFASTQLSGTVFWMMGRLSWRSQFLAVLCCCIFSGLDSQFLPKRGKDIAETRSAIRNYAWPRRLPDIDSTAKGWEFPTGTTLRVGNTIESPTKIAVTSAVEYSSLRIASSISNNFGSDFDQSKVKLVRNGTDRDSCNSSQIDIAMDANSDMGIGNPMAVSNAQGFSLSATSKTIKFMHGGFFQLCFAPDGTMAVDSFAYNAVVPPVIEVTGVASSCAEDGCLAQERWDCHFRYRSSVPSECVLRVGGNGARPGWSITPPTAIASKSRVAWTQAFAPDTLVDGQFQAEHPQACTNSDPEAVKLDPAAGVGTIGLDFTSESATMPDVALTTGPAFTVAVCYCPNYVAIGSLRCADKADFIQQIGRLYFWSIRICDISSYDSECEFPYAHFVPQQAFDLRILCPPGKACSAQSTSNSLKLVVSTDPGRQSWDPMHACRSSSAQVIWSSSSSGGDREDYKHFAPLRLSVSLNSVLDACYCDDDDCDTGADWIHVGQLQAVEAMSIASASAPEYGLSTIEYLGRPGALTFFGGIRTDEQVEDPLDAPQFSSSALVNFLSFDRRENYGAPTPTTLEQYLGSDLDDAPSFIGSMDAECQKEEYLVDFISGPSSKSTASDYVSAAGSDASRYMAFGSAQKTITAQKAGVLAICYCGVVNSSSGSALCTGPGAAWFFAGLLMIRGPLGDQKWTVTTGVIFGLTVEGWGLESTDTLRILDSGGDCAAGGSSGPPGTSSKFRVNCPSSDGSACAAPNVFHDLALHASSATSDGQNVYITAATTGSTKTTLTFSGDITGRLATGDVISIDLSTILVDGRSESQWTQADAFHAQRLSGVFKYLNNITVDDPQTRLIGQKVTLVAGTKNQMTIPVAWTTDPKFSFTSNMGLWTKHNKLSTAVDMKGTAAQSGLVVCWNAFISGERLSARAGELHIAEASQMASATVGLTTKKQGTSAPIVISIVTGQSANYHTSIVGPLVLKIVFMDVSDGTGAHSGKLVPLTSSDWSPLGSAEEFLPASEVLPGDATQSVCGKFILELWSNDDEGFPMPDGCYFGRVYRDGGASTYWREFFLVFSVGNGIRHKCHQNGVPTSCQYDVVMNAHTVSATRGDELVQVLTMCPQCSTPFQAIEQGRAPVSLTTEAGAGVTDQQLKIDGVQLVDATSASIATISETEPLRVRLFGTGDSNQQVEAGAILRLFLWPLTAWELNATCEAECEAYTAAFKEYFCGPSVDCESESTNDLSDRNNVVKLTMPTGMTPITGVIRHTINLKTLNMPSQGWFPTRFGAQLTDANDDKPFYTTSLDYVRKIPNASAGIGRLLVSGRTGYGTKPFKLQSGSSVMLRLKFGATLWRANAGSSAKLSVVLPAGYSCSNLVTTTGAGPLDSTAPVHTGTLDADGYPEYPVTSLSIGAVNGAWSSQAPGRCEYILAPYMAIFAGTVVYTRITVNNPTFDMTKLDEDNKWEFQLFGRGASSSTDSLGSSTFISLAEEQLLGSNIWASNFAVLNFFTADRQSLQPTSFQPGALHVVRLFFRPSIATGLNGFVIVDAPTGYDFGSSCQADHLSSEYYSLLGVQNGADIPTSERLRRIGSCTSSKWLSSDGFNRAKILVTTGLLKDVRYAFGLQVTNPTVYSFEQQERGWLLWTSDNRSYGLEGSKEYTPMWLNPRGDTSLSILSWGIYDNTLTGMKVEFPSLPVRPMSLSTTETLVSFDGVTVLQSGTYTLRVTAPDGIVFPRANLGSNAALGFAVRINGSSTADLPSTPEVIIPNELRFASATYSSGAVYGFQVMAQVPDYPTTTSSWSFLIEFGYDALTLPGRLQAAVISAPVIQRLLNCAVDYVGNVKDYDENYLEFSLQTATAIPKGGGLVIESSLDGFQLQCPPLVVASSQELPQDVACTVTESPLSVIIQAGSIGIPVGAYRFELKATNPSTTYSAGTWTFSSYNDTASIQIPNGVMDKDMQVRGFSIGKPMTEGYLAPVSDVQRLAMGRDDRPNRRNAVAFAFKLNSAGSSGGDLWLRGPSGFVFDDNCFPGLEMDLALVLGPNASELDAGTYTQWPASALPTECSGYGSRAWIPLQSGLQGGKLYIFRIDVGNPTQTPERNIWSIEFRGESSTPFVGFNIWTFADVQVKPASTSFLSSAPVLPVAVLFRPENNVPAETGLLALTLPSIFSVASESPGQCSAELAVLLGDEHLLYHSADIQCTLPSTTQVLVSIVGLRPLERLQLHSLAIQVRNPFGINSAQNWRLQSFSSAAYSDPASALDDVLIPGFSTTTALSAWQVTNQGNGLKGLHLTEVAFEMSPNTQIRKQDVFVLVAPTGITMQDVGYSCRELKWISTNIFNATPTCPCSAALHGSWISSISGCAMSWQSRRDAGTSSAQFSAVARNPPSMPLLVENVWTIQHWRQDAPLASSTVTSWQIQPQLRDLRIELAGENQVSGEVSQIQIDFFAENHASALSITAVSPDGFDFGGATVASPDAILDAQSISSSRVVVITNILRAQKTTILISGVRMAPTGGPTQFDVQTLQDSDYRWSGGNVPFNLNTAYVVDEVIGFQGGFRLPGKAEMKSSSLICMYAKNPTLYPTRADFEPRVNERGWVEFAMTFAQPVLSGHFLHIVSTTSSGSVLYRLETADFELTDGNQVNTTATQFGQHSLRVQLHDDLALGSEYKVRFWAIPLDIGPSMWLLETHDSLPTYPTNTNNKNLLLLGPVKQFGFLASTYMSAPAAFVQAAIQVASSAEGIGPLTLLTAENFQIMNGTCGTDCVVKPLGLFPGTQRQAAHLVSNSGGSPPLNGLLRVNVRLPELPPRDNVWLIRSLDHANQVLAWGAAEAIRLRPMQGVSIFYNALEGKRATRVVVNFEIAVAGGVDITLRAPRYYQINCRTAGALKQLALPGFTPDCIDYIGSADLEERRELTLVLNGTTLGVGQFAFGILCDLPSDAAAAEAVTGTDGTWSLVVKNSGGYIVESIFGIPPLPMTSTSVGSPILTWTVSEADQPTQITMSLTFEDPLSGIQTVLFVFPERVLHNIRTPSEFKILDAGFPVARGADRLDLMHMSLVRLFLAPNSTIPVGTFSFRFPVMLPSEMPAQNLWHLALCSGTECLLADDPGVAISFVLAGFNLGERPPAMQNQRGEGAVGSATRMQHPLVKTWVLVVSLLVLLLSN